MKIPFSPPYIDDDVISEVADALRSGWITTGPKVKLLEEEVEKLLSTEACCAVNSWTSGAILALKWLGLRPNDEVIVPAYTYCATAMAVIEAGGKPVMVDIKEDMTIDENQLLNAITPKTKAIIPMDIGGFPCNYHRIKEIINLPEITKIYTPYTDNQRVLNRIMLLSDSAHSIGAKINGQSVANYVDIAVLSFHAVKNITSAEGGMICLNLPSPFNNRELKKWFKIMSLNGQTKDAFAKMQNAGWRYDVVDMGLKINMPDVNAAIALAQIRKYDYLLHERKRVFDRYNSCLQRFKWAILPFQTDKSPKKNSPSAVRCPISDIENVYHLYPLRISDMSSVQRDRLITELAERGIATNVHYIPLPELTLFKKMGFQISDYPIANKVFEHEITLPLYPQLTDGQVDFILENLIAVHDYIVSNT